MELISNLIEQARNNDLLAFEELVRMYQDRVLTHSYRLTGDPDDAEDLAQDVFVQAFKGIKSFRNDADFGTWLHRITVNTWINRQRRKKQIIAFSLDEPLDTGDGQIYRELAASDETPLEKVERQELNTLLGIALNKLKPEYRTVLLLREIEGHSYEEIAAMLECSLGTVKSRINRARRDLKLILDCKF